MMDGEQDLERTGQARTGSPIRTPTRTLVALMESRTLPLQRMPPAPGEPETDPAENAE
jgi:hypothetical protein